MKGIAGRQMRGLPQGARINCVEEKTLLSSGCHIPRMLLLPALSLLIWAGLAFLVLPFVMIVRNGSAGDLMPLSMSWHASRMTLSLV